MLYISTFVLQSIQTAIANHLPERGGALLGLVGQPIITDFLLDDQALTSGASYLPSPRLTERVQQLEASSGLEFKGVIHSHPGGYDRPSSPDEIAMLEGLNLNPHMPYFVAPIVTMQPPLEQLRSHELALEQGKISFYVGNRSHRSRVRVEPVTVREISESDIAQMLSNQPPVVQPTLNRRIRLRPDLERICQTYRCNIPPEIFVTEIEGHNIPVGRIILEGGLELLFLFSHSYPVIPPVLWVTPPGGNTEEVQLHWSLHIPESERLLTAVQQVFIGEGSYQKVYGTPGKFALTTDGDRARLAGCNSSFYSASDPKAAAVAIQQGLFARSQGLLSQHISNKRVLIIGTGSVGSYFAEQLVRSGVGAFTLIDPETVGVENLCRTNYDVNDLNRPKVEALGGRLLLINPLVELTIHAKSISDLEITEFDGLVQQADLVIATTDDPDAQRIINRFAYHHNKPALFVGLYQGAEGGEVIFTIPERTPCYLCATANRHKAEQDLGRVSPDMDYGTARLVGEVALAVDIHHVTSVAVKMALSLLLPEDAQAKLKGFLNPLIDAKQNFLTLSMVPNYWFYPAIFGETPGQYAYQSVWLNSEHREECPVCGSVHHRIDPRKISLKKVQASNIQALLNSSSS